ncbi:MAG: LysR substrate-binding domain-containing protein [Pseudomonadota bacterium]
MTRQLRYIVAAAREGSITAAAEAESISASSILSAIDKFESYYQKQIFVRRRSKGLTVTVTGERVLAQMRHLLDEMDAFESSLKQVNPTVSGELRVGVFVTMAAHVMPYVLKSLHEEHPELQVNHFEGSLRDVEAALRSGKVDIALTYGAYLSDDLDVTYLFDAPPHALLSVRDRLAESETVSVREMSERPLILLNSPDSAQYILSIFSRSGYRPKIKHRTTSYELIRSSVALGVGASIVNIRPISDITYSGEQVVCRPLTDIGQDLVSRVAVVSRKDEVLGARATAFLQHCMQLADTPLLHKIIVT